MRVLALAFCCLACASTPPEPVEPPASGSVAPEAPVVVASAEPEPPATVAAEPPPPPSAEPAEPPPPAIAEPPASVAPPAPPPPAVPANARDPRVANMRPRERSMMILEIQALERLYQATSKASPDRAHLMRRLAENYVELEYTAAKEPDGTKLVLAARKSALKYYLVLRSDYPTYAKLDEVLYYAGYEHERGGELPSARALYRELAKKFPSSPFLARIPAKVLRR